MRIQTLIREQLAQISRSLPDFRGKATVGKRASDLLTDNTLARECIVGVNMKRGYMMRLDIRSRTEAWAYWTGQYDDQCIDLITSVLPDRATLFDVGANVGFYTMALGNHIRKTQGQVVAFEPIASNYERLLENVRINNLEDVVSTMNVALGDFDGTVRMNLEQNNGASTGNGVILRNHTQAILDASDACTVKCLDGIADELGIDRCDFIKIDVEGYELRFIQGAKAFIEEYKPILFGEFNNYWIRQNGDSILDVDGILTPLGYTPYKLSGKKLERISTLMEDDQDIW